MIKEIVYEKKKKNQSSVQNTFSLSQSGTILCIQNIFYK